MESHDMTAVDEEKTVDNYGGGIAYWSNRHAEDAQQARTFDCLFEYTALRGLLRKYVVKDAVVLHLGCGNSRLSLEWAAEGGVGRIVDVDFSPTLIAELRSQRAMHAVCSIDVVSYEVGDVRDLGREKFPNDTFDAVLDKATFDCISCNASYQNDLEAMLLEVFRVLRPGGVYLLISMGDPESRLLWLHEETGLDWTVSVCPIPLRSRGSTDLNFSGGSDEDLNFSSCSEVEVSDEIRITETGEWEEQLGGLTEDDYSFVYICRKSDPSEHVAKEILRSETAAAD